MGISTNIIQALPINTDQKLRLYGSIRKAYWKKKYDAEMYEKLMREYTLFPQNSYYGHEYWLKKYSGYENSIKAIIEHGICYKCETVKVGWDVEWDAGSIITFGDMRYDALSEVYPDYNILEIGPRIHYAPTDENYLNELRNQIDTSGKTMVLYPSHSLAGYKSEYNVDEFLDDAYQFAKDNGITNILVSLHPSDIIHGYDKEYIYRDKKLILVTGGTDQLKFLPRLKAILTIADITYSNLVGTHVGYSVYMNKPHVINSRSEYTNNENLIKQLYNIEDAKMANSFQEEKNTFARVFNGNDPWIITREQKDLIEYYFGLSKVMSKDELYRQLKHCEELYAKKFGR